jgi:hypothetical protein
MGVMESGSDRAGRDAEHLGDLGRLESDEMAQHDERALLGREASEATLQLVAIGDAQEVVRRAGKIDWEDPDGRAEASLTPRHGDARPDKETVQPRVEAVRIAESGQVTPSDHQRVLDGILGPIDVAEDPLCDREEPVTADTDQVGVGLPIAATSRLNEIAIHLHRSSSALSGAPVRTLLGAGTPTAFNLRLQVSTPRAVK